MEGGLDLILAAKTRTTRGFLFSGCWFPSLAATPRFVCKSLWKRVFGCHRHSPVEDGNVCAMGNGNDRPQWAMAIKDRKKKGGNR